MSTSRTVARAMARRTSVHPTIGRALRAPKGAYAAVHGYRYTEELAAGAPGSPAAARQRNAIEQCFDAHDPGIWKWRHYFDVDDRHLAKFVGRHVHVAEVGVFDGGSLAMIERLLAHMLMRRLTSAQGSSSVHRPLSGLDVAPARAVLRTPRTLAARPSRRPPLVAISG